MIYALERDGQSSLTFQGERLGIGAHAEWDQWTQVTIVKRHPFLRDKATSNFTHLPRVKRPV